MIFSAGTILFIQTDYNKILIGKSHANLQCNLLFGIQNWNQIIVFFLYVILTNNQKYLFFNKIN